MDRQQTSMIIGCVLLVIGICIMFFVFFRVLAIVEAPGEFFNDQLPEEEEEEGPSAEFSWDSDDLSVQFTDESIAGNASIVTWEWDFGDGSTSNYQNPQHTYGDFRDYSVKLNVEDANGKRSSAFSMVIVAPTEQRNGHSQSDFGDFDFSFDMGSMLLPLAIVLIVTMLHMIMFLVGAAITKAGWNLVKPGPTTLKLKIKPKRVEAEFEGTKELYQTEPEVRKDIPPVPSVPVPRPYRAPPAATARAPNASLHPPPPDHHT